MENTALSNNNIPSELGVADVLNKLFSDQAYHYDLKAGTVRDTASKRIIYLSDDLIRGIHHALYHETGDAWSMILQNCGYHWGKRVAKSLTDDFQAVSQRSVAELSVADYLQMIETYFSSHGWGKMTINLDHAQSHGIVRASLNNSLFAHALNEVQERVDFLIAGMLRGLFEDISSCELDCIQISCERSNDGNHCEFLISAPQRIQKLQGELDPSGMATDDAIAILATA